MATSGPWKLLGKGSEEVEESIGHNDIVVYDYQCCNDQHTKTKTCVKEVKWEVGLVNKVTAKSGLVFCGMLV